MKLISLNIEGNKHYNTVVPFLKKAQADIVCLQEAFEEDLPLLAESDDYKNLFFTPMTKKKVGERYWTFGHVIMTSHNARLLETTFYYTFHKDETLLPLFDRNHVAQTVNRAVTIVEVKIDSELFSIANTHFTWTPDGYPDENQRREMPLLLDALAHYPELVLCGDFNAPRGRGMWERLCEKYTDNIPQEVQNTLDPTFHRAPSLRLVVDGMFSTPGYSVQNVKVRSGISDHCAVIGEVEKELRN